MTPKNYSVVCYVEGPAYDKVRAIQEKLFRLKKLLGG